MHARFLDARDGGVRPRRRGILLYMAGQAMSTLKWRLLLGPVGPVDAIPARCSAFTSPGMFFNLFLPTIVGGDAVKAVLLARETGAPARATMSVFMERNTGLCALLADRARGRLARAVRASARRVARRADAGCSRGLRVGQHRAAEPAGVSRLVDRVIAATPLARMRARAASLYEAVAPYNARGRASLAGAFCCRSSSSASSSPWYS